jgi:hypothetical protein
MFFQIKDYVNINVLLKSLKIGFDFSHYQEQIFFRFFECSKVWKSQESSFSDSGQWRRWVGKSFRLGYQGISQSRDQQLSQPVLQVFCIQFPSKQPS